MRQALRAALVATLAVGCGVSVPVAPTERFVPEDAAPRCELKAGASPEAVAARDALLARWAQVRKERAAREAELAAFARDLGLAEADESLIVDRVATRMEKLNARGCKSSCEGGDCMVSLSVACELDPAAQKDADKLVAAVRAHAAKLKWEAPPAGPNMTPLYSAMEPDRCDLNPPAYDLGASMYTMHMSSALSTGMIQSLQNGCPASIAHCDALCNKGDGVACGYVAMNAKTSEERVFEAGAKACDSDAAIKTDSTSGIARVGCSKAFGSGLLATHEDLRARAEALFDKVCGESPLTDRCASAVAAGAKLDWLRARPVFTKVATTLPSECEAMGPSRCSMLAYGFFPADGPALLDAAARAKIVTAMRHACDAGQSRACVALGSEGFATSEPTDKRVKDLEHACDLDLSGCWSGVYCFGKGKCPGISADPERARHANQKLCDDFTSKVKDASVVATYAPCKDAK